VERGMTTKDEVDAYLALAKRLIEAKASIFVMRPKNSEALLALGMTKTAALSDVAALTAESYCGGPEADRDRPEQNCWKFGSTVGTTDVYIKLVIETLADGRQRLKVLSYHQAEFDLRYPHRKPSSLGGAKK
jgi:hypothetical protein